MVTPIQPIHARHGQRVVGDDHEARVGALRMAVEQVAEALDIGVIERRVDLVQHADRRGLVRNTAKISAMAVSACSPPESSDRSCGRLPGGRAMISRPGLQRIVGLDQLQFRPPAAEQGGEQRAKWPLTISKAAISRCRPSRLRLGMPCAQLGDGGRPDRRARRAGRRAASATSLGLLLGPQVDRAETLALAFRRCKLVSICSRSGTPRRDRARRCRPPPARSGRSRKLLAGRRALRRLGAAPRRRARLARRASGLSARLRDRSAACGGLGLGQAVPRLGAVRRRRPLDRLHERVARPALRRRGGPGARSPPRRSPRPGWRGARPPRPGSPGRLSARSPAGARRRASASRRRRWRRSAFRAARPRGFSAAPRLASSVRRARASPSAQAGALLARPRPAASPGSHRRAHAARRGLVAAVELARPGPEASVTRLAAPGRGALGALGLGGQARALASVAARSARLRASQAASASSGSRSPRPSSRLASRRGGSWPGARRRRSGARRRR